MYNIHSPEPNGPNDNAEIAAIMTFTFIVVSIISIAFLIVSRM